MGKFKHALQIVCDDLGITEEQFNNVPDDVKYALLKYWSEPGFEEVLKDINYAEFTNPLNNIDKEFHRRMREQHPVDDYNIAGGGIVDDDGII